MNPPVDYSVLEDIGLTSSEIKVYISLLELGSASAGKILERSRIQNSVVHRSLNSLIGKGIISYILEGKRKVYQASDPENFYDFVEDKKRRLALIMPELRMRQELMQRQTYATIFRGKRGIHELYMNLLKSNGPEYNSFGGGKDVTHKVMGESWWKGIHAKRLAHKIPSRQVFDESIKGLGLFLNDLPLTQIRFLPRRFEQLQETVIIGDFVGISIFSDTPYGILIKDKTVANGYRKEFELLWSIAKDYKKSRIKRP